MPYYFFSKWEKQKTGKRDETYRVLTSKIDAILLESLFGLYPHLKDKIQFTFSGTPLTNKHYLGYIHGECIGLENTPRRYTTPNLNPKSGIENVYLTGQDICSPGFSGALSGAVLAANAILGYGTLMDILLGRECTREL